MFNEREFMNYIENCFIDPEIGLLIKTTNYTYGLEIWEMAKTERKFKDALVNYIISSGKNALKEENRPITTENMKKALTPQMVITLTRAFYMPYVFNKENRQKSK